MGDAVTATLLLSDWERYGLSERVSYHFDLTEALSPQPSAASSTHNNEAAGNNEGVADGKTKHGTTPSSTNNVSNNEEEDEAPSFTTCGVVGMIECVPFTPLTRLTKRQKRAFRNEIRDFNLACMRVREAKKVSCYEPRRLPLRLNPASRLFFAYEVTRMVFCLDASPTLTATFGGMDHDATGCCPMDRVASMAKMFFKALVEPIEAPSIPIQKVWRPELEVSVIAVYPRGTGLPQTSLLVRDFRVCDLESAELLAQKIAEWALQDVESEIARRLSQTGSARNNLLNGFDAWSIQLHSSSLRDILDAGDVSLSILSSAAKPCIVVATDGRSVSCDGVMDILADADRSDVPLVVLDLSSPHSHSQYDDDDLDGSSTVKFDHLSLIQYDPGGPSTFPLHLSDDTEALQGICRATGGCFFDAELLQQAAQTKAGQLEDSPFHVDHYFSFKRRSLKPNAVQWYLLFSLSPLSPTFNSAWGQIIPPKYLRHRPQLNAGLPQRDNCVDKRQLPWNSNNRQSPTSDFRRVEAVAQRKPLSRTTFSTYIINPIRIKGLLMMRIKEGYRARQYGQSTQDTDKVLIQFNLPLELKTVLHYELSYKALPNLSHMVGVAHIKIELSGEPGFIQSVKNDFLRQTHVGRPVTMAQQVSARLCKILRWIRREDCLQSYLCPLKWSGHLADPETPFVRRLRTLTGLQRRKHFRLDQFDCVCTGMGYDLEDGFLSEFWGSDNGEQELVDTIAEWSSQTIKEGCRYVKRTDTADGNLANYCVIDLVRPQAASRVFTISVESFGGTGARDRLELLATLKDKLSKLRDVDVFPKQMADYVVGPKKQNSQWDPHSEWKRTLLEDQHHHATWELAKDPELLPLILKRRSEIGSFILLESSDDHAILAKLEPAPSQERNEDFLQYQIAICKDRVVISLHMESTSGDFFPFRSKVGGGEVVTIESGNSANKVFHKIARTLRRRDQECSRALTARTALLKVFQEDGDQARPTDEDEAELSCVQRLLPYASKVSRRLRFFKHAGNANGVLQLLAEDMLLLDSYGGVRVARLPIDRDENVGGIGKGSWFLIRFNEPHTMSIVHFSLTDQEDIGAEEDVDSFAYRDLTFFTIGTSDLYSQRDDIANDDDSTNSHISEYLAMVEFADHWDDAYRNIYASAAYAACQLKLGPVPAEKSENFHPSDLEKVLSVCEFVEVASVLISGTPNSESDTTSEGSKLQALVFTVLGLVVGCADDYTLFYYRRGDEEEVVLFDAQETDSLSAFDELEVTDIDTETEEKEQDHLGKSVDEMSAAAADFASRSDDGFDRLGGSDDVGKEDLDNHSSEIKEFLSTPLFVRFTLDGEPANLDDLSSITKSSTLAAHLSVFKDERLHSSRRDLAEHAPELPAVHGKVALELVALMNAYVAEQSLERLRHFGHELTEDDLKVVKGCLRGARNVIKSKIEVYFYSAKVDAMVPAFAPAGGELAIEQGFELLKSELEKNASITLRPFPGDVFVSMESTDTRALDFWCFINLRRTHISISVHHSQGSEMAMAVMADVQEMISHSCHRVNQQLLLRRLHQSRTASELLIPKDDVMDEEPETDPEQLFMPGVFSCPVVFQTSFDLFHRCATNPSQVARKLEGTVLHSFAVSNRHSVFVYKDETGDVFYMLLKSHGGGVEPDGIIDLLVYGIQEPGPSITIQLTQIFRRRLLLIAVDMLSAVLTKNPHFHWKRADLNFIRCFKDEWRSLDESHNVKLEDHIAEYEFPYYPADAGMILLYFRQNICGSTFYHRLNSSADSKHENADDNEQIIFNPHDFTFYYNNSPSKLDPKFQSVSTLTEKGAEYSRQAGAGMAIITVSLVYSDGQPVDKIRYGLPAVEAEGTDEFQERSLLMVKVGRSQGLNDEESPERKVRVRITIMSTALKLHALHSWVLLTLNQAYSAWCAERLLERMQLNLVKPTPTPGSLEDRTTFSQWKTSWIGHLCPGLPALESLIDTSHDLPHPAFVKTMKDGTIRASSVASIAMDLIETVIAQSAAETRKAGPGAKFSMSDMVVIRRSRSGTPQLVQLVYSASKKEVLAKVVQEDGNGALIRDKPIDCPEYICCGFDTKYRETKSESTSRKLPMLFKEVIVDDGNSDRSSSIARLEKLKQSHPKLFFRTYAFFAVFNRDRRTFFSYNFAPQVAKAIISRLQEKERALLKSAEISADTLQLRALKLLSPSTEGTSVKREGEHGSSQGYERKVERGSVETRSSTGSAGAARDTGHKPRASRPSFIRRPKLVGKSVEGAAMQAVAASRARASNKQRFTRGAPGGAGQSHRGQSDDASESTRNSQVRREEKPSAERASQQKRQAMVQADASLSAAISRFNALLSQGSTSMRQRSSQHWNAVQKLAYLWWPSDDKGTIPRSVAEFILSRSPRVWSFVREIPPMPPRLMHTFIRSLTHTIRMFHPDIALLPVPSQDVGKSNSVLLMGEMKGVRSCRCLAIFKLSMHQFGGKGRQKNILRSQGWITTLPRHQKAGRQARLSNDTSLSERDATAFDKLTTDLHYGVLDLDCMIVDFVGFVIERVMRSLDTRLVNEDTIPLIRNVFHRYPLKRQHTMFKLNYRVFRCTIVLSSYQNRLINLYESPVQYQWLLDNVSDRGLISCGTEGLCFKKEVVLPNGIHSICFLTCDTSETKKMQLWLVSRTQGKDLLEYMFRNGSNIAMSILDNIAGDAAGLAYEELRFAAQDLRCKELWAKITGTPKRKADRPKREDVDELLSLVSPVPLMDRLSPLDRQRVFMVVESGLDWPSCCAAMEKEPSFSPSHDFASEEGRLYLFFMKDEDLFLVFRLNQKGDLQGLDLVSKDQSAFKEGKDTLVIQKFTNYLLKFLWLSI